MAIVVKHNSTADGDPLIDGDDWNANHTITGGGTFRLPQLVETKTLSAESTTTFSSLNGDTAGEYLLIIDVTIAQINAAVNLNIRPNNDTGNNYAMTIYRVNSGGSGAGYQDIADLYAGTNVTNKITKIFGQTHFNPTSGVNRRFKTEIINIVSSDNRQYHYSAGEWRNSADNITSLVCVLSNASATMTGTIKLYKMVDLAI